MHLLSRVAVGLLGGFVGLGLACQMGNPAFDRGDDDETLGDADSVDSLDSSPEAGSNSMGDGDPGDGDPGDGDGDGDGDPNTGDGDGDGDGEPSTGDGDGDGEPSTGDGDGDPPLCGDGNVDPGEECDDGNGIDDDFCTNDCKVNMGGDGDGDGDGDGMMMMCPAVVDPITCHDCVLTHCCEPAPMDCLQNNKCLCVVDCLLGGDTEMACYEMCVADNNDSALVELAYPCMLEFCFVQCQGG